MSPSSAESTLCFNCSNRENSESLSTFLVLNAQQIPRSVGTGLKSLVQLTSWPCRTHLFRRCADPGAGLWQGRLEGHRRLNRLLRFRPISCRGKFAIIRSFITFSVAFRSFLFSLLRNTSISGKSAELEPLCAFWIPPRRSLLHVFSLVKED